MSTSTERRWIRVVAAAMSLGAAATAASAQSPEYVMIPDWTDRIMLFSATDGAIVNLDFIPDGGAAYDFGSPKEALQVGNEIWVSDQITDSVFRFTASLTPTFLGTITGGLDNVRGIAVAGSTLFVSNSDAMNGAPGDAVVMFTTAGAPAGFFPIGDPFDVLAYQGDILVAGVVGDVIQRFTTAGVFVSTFHDSDGISGIDWPQQIHEQANGNILIAGFDAPEGIFEYSPAGVQINYWAGNTSGSRGVYRLGNGKILFTEGGTGMLGGVKVIDPSNGQITPVLTGSNFQYINPLTLAPPPCAADWDGNGQLQPADVASFVTTWFGNLTGGGLDADFDENGAITPSDVAAFVSAWAAAVSAGC